MKAEFLSFDVEVEIFAKALARLGRAVIAAGLRRPEQTKPHRLSRVVATPRPPDVLHRPAPRPREVVLVAVAARRIGGWSQLDQILDDESAFSKQRQPGPVRQLKRDRFARLL